jgi:hypothetical protein
MENLYVCDRAAMRDRKAADIIRQLFGTRRLGWCPTLLARGQDGDKLASVDHDDDSSPATSAYLSLRRALGRDANWGILARKHY